MKSFIPLILFSVSAQLQAATTLTLEPYAVPSIPALFEEFSASETVENQKPVDVAEILAREIASVAYVRKGPVAGDFLLRGLGRDNVLVSLDGGRTCGACPNRMDPPAFHVSSARIDSISVRTGPFDVEEGGVVGGLVRVSTGADVAENYVETSLFGGSFNTFDASALGGFTSDALQASGALDYRQGDPYKDGDGNLVTDAPKGPASYKPADRDRTAYSIFGGDARAVLSTENAEWIASGGVNLADDVLYPGLRMDADYDRSYRGGLTYQRNQAVPIADTWAAQFSASTVDHRMDDRFRLSSASQPAWRQRGYMMRTDAETLFWSARLRANKDTGSVIWNYGTGFDERIWDADNTIMNVNNDMLPDVVTRSVNLWVNAAWEINEWDLEAGGRLEGARSEARDSLAYLQSVRGNDSNAQEDLLPSGYLMARHPVVENQWIQFGLGHGERLPDPQERYIQLRHPNPMMPDWIGNPDLKPVTNTEFQARIGGDVGDFDYTFGTFYAYLADFVYLASLPGSAKRVRTYENIDAELYGIDASIGWQISDPFRIDASIAWQKGRKLTLSSGNDDRDLGEIPPLSGRLAGVWTPLEELSVTAEGIFADAQEDLDEDLGEVRIAGYALLNLRLSWEVNETIRIGTGVDNVFDKNYAVHNAYLRDPFSAGVVVNEPGRFLYLRVAARF